MPSLVFIFIPFQLKGLWLEVTITPASAPNSVMQYDSAGVGTKDDVIVTGMLFCAIITATVFANSKDRKRVS